MKNKTTNVGSFAIAKFQAISPWLIAIALVAVIGFSMVACGEADDGGGGGDPGKLTITGLGDYNGKYVIAAGEAGTKVFWAVKSMNISEGEVIYEKINGGSVVLNVWEIDTASNKSKDYKGSDTIGFQVSIFSKEKANFGDDQENELIATGELTVTFTNGTASGTLVEISLYDDEE
jgi:hypothetical protein